MDSENCPPVKTVAGLGSVCLFSTGDPINYQYQWKADPSAMVTLTDWLSLSASIFCRYRCLKSAVSSPLAAVSECELYILTTGT